MNQLTETQPQADPGPQPLERAALTEVVELALWTAQLLMQNGAESQRVEETVRVLGAGLGCDWGDVLVSHNAVIISHASGNEFRTKIRRVAQGGVNMSLIEEISHLTHRVEEGLFDRTKVRAELERISRRPHHYNRWFVVAAVGLACAAFSRLFNGGWPIFGATWLASSLAMFVRQELIRRNFNNLLAVVVSAFTAAMGVGLLHLWPIFGRQVEVGLAASVLFLVPGVPFINAVEDLIKGYTVVGLARGAISILIILSIALGVLIAMQLIGVNKL